MRIIFDRVKLHNFFSFEDAELQLSDMGYSLVSGRNHCLLDSAYSNGSGKSSLFNGIFYALTGETAQGLIRGVENIFSNPEDCWVELSFYADSDYFVVKRICTPRGDLKITINGEDYSGKGKRESTGLLGAYLPEITSELLGSIIILGQGMPMKFSANRPSKRKEVLEKLTKSDFMIQEIKDRINLRIDQVRADIRRLEDESLSRESTIKVHRDNLLKLTEEKNRLENLKNSFDNINQLKDQLGEYTDYLEKIKSQLTEVGDNCAQWELNKASLTSERDSKIAEQTDKLDLLINEKIQQRVEISGEISSLKREIQQLESIKDVCPTCGQKIPGAIKPDTTQKRLQLEQLQKKNNDLLSQSDQLKIDRRDVVNRLTDEYNSRIGENIYTHKILELSQEINSYTEKCGNLQRTIHDYNQMEENSSKIENDIADVNEVITRIQSEINSLISDKAVANSRLEVLQQMLILAKRDFRGILLEGVINHLNQIIGVYSKEVFNTNLLKLTLNDNDLDISYCNKPYENLSGGEKQKVDVIIQLALRKMISSQLNIHSNLLICDEIYDGMDAISCQRITGLIQTLTDIDSVFIISHYAQDLDITYDNNILVQKNENGISSISFV